jgi:hypothetical protein
MGGYFIWPPIKGGRNQGEAVTTVTDSNEWKIPDKALFEMLQSLQQDVISLRTELQQTRADMRAYNGLRESQADMLTRIEELERKLSSQEATAKGKLSVADGIRLWGCCIIAIASFIIAIYRG